MTENTAPQQNPNGGTDEQITGPDDVIGGGNAVAGGNPARGAANPDQRGEAPTDADGEVIGAGGGQGTTEKDPSQWVTGDEPMTGAQKSYLDTLAREAGETLPANLTKAEASEHIDRLQSSTGRGDNG